MNTFFKKLFMSPETLEELEFMPPAVAAHRRGTPRQVPIMMLTLIAFGIISLLWAKFAFINIVAHGEGKIIPSSAIQKVSNLEGGIIQEILVKEGQIVQKSQLLMKIDPTLVQARLKEGQENYYRYRAEVARLKALTTNRPFEVPADVKEKAPAVAREAQEHYEARQQRLSNEIEISQKELDQKIQEQNELKVRVEGLRKAANLSQQEINIQRPLVEKGLASRMEFLKGQQDLNEVQNRLESTLINQQKAAMAVTQAQQKLAQIAVVFRNEDYMELREAENHLNQAEGILTSQGDITSRTGIQAPVKGIVKEIHLTTLGGVIKPGENILDILPLDDNLIVEVNIKPSDIAFIHPGDPALIKISAYDSSIYGGLQAELIDISPDTVVDEKDPHRSSYYKVKLRTKSLQFTKSHQEKPLIPGMTVVADITTGSQTVLDYLLKPIRKGLADSLTER